MYCRKRFASNTPIRTLVCFCVPGLCPTPAPSQSASSPTWHSHRRPIPRFLRDDSWLCAFPPPGGTSTGVGTRLAHPLLLPPPWELHRRRILRVIRHDSPEWRSSPILSPHGIPPSGSLDILRTGQYCHLHSAAVSVGVNLVGSPVPGLEWSSPGPGCPLRSCQNSFFIRSLA
jgi:hypothetical protein